MLRNIVFFGTNSSGIVDIITVQKCTQKKEDVHKLASSSLIFLISFLGSGGYICRYLNGLCDTSGNHHLRVLFFVPIKIRDFDYRVHKLTHNFKLFLKVLTYKKNLKIGFLLKCQGYQDSQDYLLTGCLRTHYENLLMQFF